MEITEIHKYMVCVECPTFNHRAYIEDAMNGFCMQQTNFPFVCVIVDDASTDGEQEVIKKYFDAHFDLSEAGETDDYVMTFGRHKTNENCYFAVLYLKYNHYSIKKDKVSYYARWQNNCKYIAFCEGDDYWIDSTKLQRQTDALKSHPECSCSGHGFITKYQHNNDEIDFTIYDENKESFMFSINDFGKKWVLKTLTCLYKKDVFDSYAGKKYKYAKDVTIQYHALKMGNGIYITQPMGVYNVQDGGVWSALSNKEREKGNYNTLKELYLQNDKDKTIKPILYGIVRPLMCYETNFKQKLSYLKECLILSNSFKQYIKDLFLFPYSIIFRHKYSDSKEEYLKK